MLELDYFSYGWVTPALAYVMSFIGSVLGLRCTFHARDSEHPGGWLVAAAISLGGAGIWVMHFTAMLGFSIHGAAIRYDLPLTLLSAVVAIVVVWIGLSLVVRWRREALALPIGGAITGLGVAGMHYLGMFAMQSDVDMHYSVSVVLLSVLIAVVAATAALWFMLHVKGLGATFGAAMIMGLAVCGMHYTGMASMSAERPTGHGGMVMSSGGVDPVQLLTPLIMTVTLVTMMLIVLVGVAELDERGTAEAEAAVAAMPSVTTSRALSTDPAALPSSGRSWPRTAPSDD
ncbi:MHYT domain-containing protein [Nocardia macrotermitis]|uniref:Putative signaling protein n=1 Tax=Nocardia macrotermitis TaxID=2585198 RepID=A0A7K0CX01_9NOCA|nr:MHYT domain-containing protein [Nocardia macrotermitis]MQY17184.1 putative signaling protein [Nocardia macrotermitis]